MTIRRVTNYWNRVAKRKELGYWDVPGWQEHQNLLASGQPNVSWLEVFVKQLRGEGWRPGRALSLGCGTGYLESRLTTRKVRVGRTIFSRMNAMWFKPQRCQVIWWRFWLSR